MKPKSSLLLFSAMILMLPAAIQAAAFTFGAPGISCSNSVNANACAGPQYNIWNTGDFISQTFSGAGIPSANQLTLNLALGDSLSVGQTESLAIDLNNIQVGTLSETGPGATNFAQTFNFAPISGANYTVLFTVLDPGVPGGQGTIGLITANAASSATITGSVSTTPEPSSWLLLLTGAVAFVALRPITQAGLHG